MTIAGQHILITAGAPKEGIDGIRHYANRAHPELAGLEAAKQLVAQGAKVTLVAPDLATTLLEGMEIISKKPDGMPVTSARDLMEATADYAKRAKDIKAVLHLANISSIRAAKPSAQKLKIKKDAGQAVAMEVVGNVDAWQRLKAAFPDVPIIGYQHNRLTATSPNSLAESVIKLLEKTPQPADKQLLAKTIPDSGAALAGRKIIITSGPTAEKLTTQGDIITNFSTGRQGHAIAEALAGMGAKVTLVTGPTNLLDPTHPNIVTLHATSARDMQSKVMAQLPADAYIGVAAVADFGMERPISLHLKEDESHTLQLVQNPDILQAVGQHPSLRPKAVIGFAAETDHKNMLLYARDKLERKSADAVCANRVNPTTARGSYQNQIVWVTKSGADPWKMMGKHEAGRAIGAKILKLLDSSGQPICQTS